MPEPVFFHYGVRETETLKAKDPLLGAAIDRIGPLRREVTPNLFEALIGSIVAQQISNKALATVWDRVMTRFAPLTPARLIAIEAEDIQRCGMSLRKARCIRAIAGAVGCGALDLDTLKTLPDNALRERLQALPGIGVWTAEMLMIFSLQRGDVISFGDLALQRGLRMLYRHRRITPALFQKYRRRYTPYASVASLYLWAIASGALPELSDPAPQSARKR